MVLTVLIIRGLLNAYVSSFSSFYDINLLFKKNLISFA